MKKIILFALTFLVVTIGFGQDFVLKTQLFSGTQTGFYQKVDNIVVNTNQSGEIIEILMFDSAAIAEEFIQNPTGLLKPTFKVAAGGVPIYVNTLGEIEYYSPNEYNSGEIKQIAGLNITYYTPSEYNSGKLKKLGSISFKYYTPQEYNDGKVKEIGGIQVKYYTPQEYNSGKLKQVGDVSIKYYTPQEYNAGKLKSVGKISIQFYTPQEYNAGSLKKVEGEDGRVRLL